MNIIKPYESVPVKIGNFTMYCEKFKSSGNKSFSEQNTVAGDEVITNSGKKAVRIIFSGRISGDNPLDFLTSVNNMMYNNENFSVQYKNIVFGKCQVQAFVVNDENNDFISANITLIASEVSTKSGESV
ncbi:MAG: hypothetical protein K2L10_01470 [Ruminococcus sp.]|nr:hypothetical protein [Ruminococcus sp.]